MAKQKIILIIEDDEDIVFLLQTIMERENYKVHVAYNGKDGLKMIGETKPDLILLDIMMPEVNGYEICREIKNDPKTKDIRVIMLSAKALESDKFWGKETGADEYITKPFEREYLIKRVHSLLKK